MNHPITPLTSAQVNHDHLKVELVEPDGMPPAVRITWPAAPTIVKPEAISRCRRSDRPTLLREHTLCLPA
jgi:hypothetical protein